MSQRCPYCGEEKRAVKNHVRLASGEGHGPSGQYPDDFGERGDQDDGGGADPSDPSHGDGGSALTVEAVEETETSTEADSLKETDDGGEGEEIVAMPEGQLNSMLKTAASMKPEGDDEAESSSTTEESSSTSIDVDPVETVENADAEGWPLWKILLVLGLAALAAITIGAIKEAAENGQEQAHEFAQQRVPTYS